MMFGFNVFTFIFLTIAVFAGELLYDIIYAIWDKYHDNDDSNDDYDDTASI